MNYNGLQTIGQMHMGWPNQQQGTVNPYADKTDAWVASLLEQNRYLAGRIKALEDRLDLIAAREDKP